MKILFKLLLSFILGLLTPTVFLIIPAGYLIYTILFGRVESWNPLVFLVFIVPFLIAFGLISLLEYLYNKNKMVWFYLILIIVILIYSLPILFWLLMTSGYIGGIRLG